MGARIDRRSCRWPILCRAARRSSLLGRGRRCHYRQREASHLSNLDGWASYLDGSVKKPAGRIGAQWASGRSCYREHTTSVPWSARFLDADRSVRAHAAVAAAVQGTRRYVRRSSTWQYTYASAVPLALPRARPSVRRPSIKPPRGPGGQWWGRQRQRAHALSLARVRASPAMAATQSTPRSVPRQIEQTASGARVLQQTRRRSTSRVTSHHQVCSH